MDINTDERHERTHHVVLSKSDVEYLLKCAVAEHGAIPLSPAVTWDIRWGEAGIDSGLRKEPQITITATEKLP